MTWPERCERHFLISVTHTTLHFGLFFQENCYKTAHTGQRHNLSSVTTWSKVLEQPPRNKSPTSADSPWLFLSFSQICSECEEVKYILVFGVHIKSWQHLGASPLPPSTQCRAQGSSPGALCANRASCMTASFGWMALGSGSIGTGDPSLDRLSGVWTPLECADNTPEWLGEAGALL